MSHLPILVPGRTEPVLVPCRLPNAFSFPVFLPARGLRNFTAWLSTQDPLTAEVADVTLGAPEKDARLVLLGGAYALDEDEKKRAKEAADDVLSQVLSMLGLTPGGRNPIPVPVALAPIAGPLHAIAKAWEAEEAAAAAGFALLNLFKSPTHRAGIDNRIPDLTAPSGQDASPACEALRCYVDYAVDAACIAQADKAERQQATWEPPPLHPEDRNPPAWAE